MRYRFTLFAAIPAAALLFFALKDKQEEPTTDALYLVQLEVVVPDSAQIAAAKQLLDADKAFVSAKSYSDTISAIYMYRDVALVDETKLDYFNVRVLSVLYSIDDSPKEVELFWLNMQRSVEFLKRTYPGHRGLQGTVSALDRAMSRAISMQKPSATVRNTGRTMS